MPYDLLDAVERAAKMIRQLLLVGRRQVMDPVDLDVGEVVSAMASLLQPLVGKAIVMSIEVQPNLPRARADASMLEQVLLNLALGSLYAWSVFVLPLEKEFGWSRTQTSWVYTIAIVCFAASFIVAGKLQDKKGPQLCAFLGALLVGGGFALDRVLVSAVTRNFDDQLQYVLRSLLASSEIGPDGEVLSTLMPCSVSR